MVYTYVFGPDTSHIPCYLANRTGKPMAAGSEHDWKQRRHKGTVLHLDVR